MIHRGDYIVPRVLGEPYNNKPPLQNWLVVLLSGNRSDRVGALPLRSISLLAIAGISCLLYALRRTQRPVNAAWLPALIFLTMGITVQYGRSGELDPLLAFWVTAALACFEIGRRREAPWLQWFVSQALLAGGILTKGLSPLFFYPPVLFRAWKDRPRIRFAARAFVLGLVAECAVVCAWLIPYALRASASLLGNRWAVEALQRTPLRQGAREFLTHLFSFPLEVLGNTLPWSALLFLWVLPGTREAMRERLERDSLLRLSLSASLWAFLILWLMPGARGRYMMPAYPFAAVVLAHTLEASTLVFARVRPSSLWGRLRGRLEGAFVRRWTGWIAVAVMWTASLLVAGLAAGSYSVWQPLCAGILAIGTVGYGVRSVGKGKVAFGGLLLAALLYAIVYAGATRVHIAENDREYVMEAEQVASWIRKPLPVVCAADVPRGVCYYIGHRLDRLLQRRPPSQGPYYLVAENRVGRQPDGLLTGEAGRFGLWEVSPSTPLEPDDGAERGSARDPDDARETEQGSPRDLAGGHEWADPDPGGSAPP